MIILYSQNYYLTKFNLSIYVIEWLVYERQDHDTANMYTTQSNQSHERTQAFTHTGGQHHCSQIRLEAFSQQRTYSVYCIYII